MHSQAWTTALSAISSLVTIGINYALRYIVSALSAREGHDTQTEYERALFTKLSLAYVMNTVIIPLLVGIVTSSVVTGNPVDQSWYESGGVVNQAMVLVVSNFAVTELLKIVQWYRLFSRYCLARFALSQQRLNQLWEPPPMLLGELYASTIKTVALCLVCAPPHAAFMFR